MARERVKLIVSDFHLGKGRYLADRTQNILEDFVYDREWVEFLEFYRSGVYAEAEVELILNGDILNLLQIDSYGVHTHLMTERTQVRALRKIIRGHPEFFEALKRFAATPGHSISYVIGNHDVGMMFRAARDLLNQTCNHTVRYFESAYVFDGVHVEHGQQYERFARLDLKRPFIDRGLPEPVLNLPWGSLFVAVLLPRIKQERPHVDKVRPFRSFLIWTLIHDLVWGVQTGFRILRFVLDTLLLKTRYQIGRGVQETLGLLREISLYPNYDKIAFRLLENHEDLHTVVFGHTHILRYRQWREGKEYFNEGSWNEVTNLDLAEYGTRVRLTYAFVEYPPTLGRPKVRLKQWHGSWKPELDVVI